MVAIANNSLALRPHQATSQDPRPTCNQIKDLCNNNSSPMVPIKFRLMATASSTILRVVVVSLIHKIIGSRLLVVSAAPTLARLPNTTQTMTMGRRGETPSTTIKISRKGTNQGSKITTMREDVRVVVSLTTMDGDTQKLSKKRWGLLHTSTPPRQANLRRTTLRP